MQHRLNRRAGERGVSLIMVTMCIFVLFGMAGLAIDTGHMYATRQRAQAAADAGVQAGVMDMYRGIGNGSAAAAAYAQQNGFIASEVAVDHPTCASSTDLKGNLWCNGHVTLSGTDTPNLIHVVITRTVPTIFMRALGQNAATVKAEAFAAITVEPQPIPILVLHPTLSGSFSKNGNNIVQICGGPPRSIQVNSASPTSINISGVSGTVDLSHAGPLDTLGTCTTGTGADLANVGTQNPYPGTLLLGTKPGQYISPASPIEDPLLGVPAPPQPVNAPPQPGNAPDPLYVCGPPSTGAPQRCPISAHGCPAALGSNDACTLYSPGYYPNGIDIKGQEFAQFRPGIYWINHGGFKLESNSVVRLASLASDQTDPLTGTGWTDNILVYNSPSAPVNATKDIFSIDSNSGKFPGNVTFPDSTQCGSDTVTGTALGGNCLQGSPPDSIYKSILFFQDHATAVTLNHSFSGGGGLIIKGTIYLTHTVANIIADGKYQSLELQGTPGGTTKVQGMIITDKLSLGGNAAVTMNLISSALFPVRQVALVQ